jgi:hypothetical protein
MELAAALPTAQVRGFDFLRSSRERDVLRDIGGSIAVDNLPDLLDRASRAKPPTKPPVISREAQIRRAEREGYSPGLVALLDAYGEFGGSG